MSKHNEAILAFQEGRVAEALRLLEELLAGHETSELWNDWAAIQLGAGDISKSEDGFTRALELDSQNADATANLGLLLLSRGNSTRAVPLLTRALPALPEEQQKVVSALLERLAREKSPVRDGESSEEQTLRVLVVHDVFPDPQREGQDVRLLQMLRALREKGDDVTFIAREAEDSKRSEPLRQAGIQTYGNDAERLPCLGKDAARSTWSFRALLEQTQFDVAILVQSFGSGISIPEHYLDDLRRYAPATRIGVFAYELHDVSPNGQGSLIDSEKAKDRTSRQMEAFERADLVLVHRDDDAAALHKVNRKLQVEVVPHYLQTVNVSGMRQHLLSLTPKAYAGENFSAMVVETQFCERLSPRSGAYRVLGQFECYVRLAEQLVSDNKPEEALEQLRHIFGRAAGLMREGYFASQVFIVLKRCYRRLSDEKTADRCAAEARRCVVMRSPSVSAGKRKNNDGPLFSVIVPTFNRLPILKKCLMALEGQTLSARDFEVIVIDDGSSDGTEELLRRYSPPFAFQYWRQTNSGTGAARRNGVAHATGEYLLLMNDDTICDRDLMKQHLQVQRAHAGERWAVLGNFEYPAGARLRALTRYFCVEPFMFPQVSMEDGCPYGYSHFITCNLSIRRQAVVEAGSFESIYKLSEDTELGIRLYERGYRVLYHPEAHAFHDHLPYPGQNLIRRARVYGADYFHMFRRHPRVMKEWAMPVNLTAMDEENAVRILSYVEAHRQEVEQAVAAVERWDEVDFEPFLTDRPDTAAMVLKLLRQAVPAIHWFYLFETMLHTMIRELGLVQLLAELPVIEMARGAGA